MRLGIQSASQSAADRIRVSIADGIPGGRSRDSSWDSYLPTLFAARPI
jgi:hypothetical protein